MTNRDAPLHPRADESIETMSRPITPLTLRPDNFTPRARTPWGGQRIASRYKPEGWVEPGQVIGESWEVSVEPDFPSRLEDTGELLSDVLAEDPEAMVGAAAPRSTALLMKLLDAADDLSVQIHPSDTYAGLAPDESGKPESWYVLEAEAKPGPAGIYLGVQPGVARRDMESALAEKRDVSELLGFVPVTPGDFFLIEAGTPHAIGRGVTLVEPQRVLPGKRGVTYRYWDWNRRYDAQGRPDPEGRPRALHEQAALDVTDWAGPRGDDLLARVRRPSGPPDLEGGARIEPLAGPTAPVLSNLLRVERLSGSGDLALPSAGRLRGLTVLAGHIRLAGHGFDLRVEAGRSVVLPAALDARAELSAAHGILAAAD
jgi:mannose-6-phosphate isomerase